MNERERIVAADAARAENANPSFYGGYDGAARTICGFFKGTYAEDYPENVGDCEALQGMTKKDLYPICAVTFSYRKVDKLTHRDFLGAVLGAGLERSMLGDILVAEDYAIVFCLDVVQEIVDGITKIGRYGVRAEHGITNGIPELRTKTMEKTLSSLRLDCVVGACTNLSREKSASLIKSGMISADFSVCQNVSFTV
ncbi:MAG: YlmH/Sll1252 family protein, partial [Oscillospiraceae bacterium]